MSEIHSTEQSLAHSAVRIASATGRIRALSQISGAHRNAARFAHRARSIPIFSPSLLAERQMRFYRMHRWEGEMSSHGYEFFTRRADAEKASREWVKDIDESKNGNWGPTGEIDEIDIEPTKAAILAALNQYASHNNNG